MVAQTQTNDLGHSSFWPKYLDGMSCTFPGLARPSSASKEPLDPTVCTMHLELPHCFHDHDDDPAGLYLAAWSLLLGLYLGAEQVCFGVVRESLMSSVMNGDATDQSSSPSLSYTACKVRIDKEKKASAVVDDCRTSLETCLSHSCSSATELSRQMGSPAHSRFNTGVCFVESEGIDATDAEILDLALVVCKSAPSGPDSCYIQFSSSLLSDSAAALVAANYRTIASQLASKLESPVGHLRMLSAEDLEKTSSWNRACPAPVDGLVHDFFAQNVLSRPNAPAVCASDASFTYLELDTLSNVLANFLVQQGTRPETAVPLCFSKSAWATVSMLAVIKAGAAFTFLDPSFPIGALQDIVSRTGARFLLCSASSRAMWSGLFPAHEVSAEAIAALPQLRDAPQSSVCPSNLLYIVFTSGSTGKPKGVCVEHSGFLSSALDFIRVTEMNSSSRVLHFASYSFDASIFESFTALLCGGCLCTPDETSREKGVAHFMGEFAITLAFLTPSLVTSFRPNDVPSLETLILMGEAPTKTIMERWTGKLRLMNAYGPSECCVASAVHPHPEPHTEAANIGWPVGGLLWVVDPNDHDQLVPVGAVGELAIEGPHLGREYLNDRVKTAKVFVDAPKWTAGFPASRIRRVYLTGDIVRRNMDGSVVFIGRRDSQVKVRGMRIELGAVEQHLLTDRLVRLATCAVIAPGNGTRQKRLAAAVSLRGMKRVEPDGDLKVFKFVNSGLEAELVRRSIREIRNRLGLPGYMIPATWFVLESFPLMPSGKIDRGKVKAWIDGMDAEAFHESQCLVDQSTAEEAHVQIRSPLVEALRREIGLVLNLPLDSVAPWKSFISLGGDSISVLQLVSQCRTQNMVLTAREIMQSKSIAKLALSISLSEMQMNVIRKEAIDFFDVPFGLSPIQQLFFRWEPEGTQAGGANRFNQSFLLQVRRPVSLGSLAAALKVVVERHPMLRCRFAKSSSSEWQQIIPKDLENSFRLEAHTIKERDNIRGILLRSQCEIDIIRGPVFAVDLINGPRGQLLSMIAAHVVIDLVSWRVLLRELESLLLQRGESMTLPPHRSLHWPAWCRLQADYATQHLPPRTALPGYNQVLPPDLEYWGMEARENKFGDTTSVVFHLDPPVTSLLMDPERHQVFRAEPIDLFLSAIIHSFTHTFTDRKAPNIFRKSHGREPWDDCIDISSSVGWFTTMYPVLMEEGSRDLVHTLRRVKDAQRRVPSNGWAYFASSFHHPDGIREFGSLTDVEIIFDFLGLYQQLERSEGLFEQESWESSDVGLEFHRPGLFEITAKIIQGQLQLKFEYNKTMKHQDDIVRWVQMCEKELSRIVLELDSMGARCMHTLRDFPLLRVGYLGRDSLFDSVLPHLGISVDNVEDVYDTSPMQTGILLSQVKDPDLYQCSTVFQVVATSPFASVDLQCLRDSWQSLIKRHSALRTIFVPDVSDEGAFCQVVLKTAEPRIARVSCLVSELDLVLKKPAHLPLHDGRPPHRLTICQVSDGGTYIRLDINHACIDGASGDIFVRDFVALYNGSIQLPEAPAYSDFISKVLERDLEKDLQYWTNRLKDVEPCHLPVLDDGVPQDGSLQMIRATSPVLVASLSRFCQSHSVTLPTAFKLVWSLVLQVYTGFDTVCFGYLVSGRDNLGADGHMKDNIFGALANILACRCDLSDTIGSLLNTIHRHSLSDLEHQYCSLAHIQRSLDSSKLANQQPLFNTILNFQVHPNTASSESSIELCEFYVYEPTEYSCVVDIAATGECFEISLTHRTSSISRGQAENIAEAFLTALGALVQSLVTMPVKGINLFGEGHSEQVWAWNRIVPPRVDMCIHDVVSRNAAAYPHALAIESRDAIFTYEELNVATTQLSFHLARLGVGPGSIVLLCFAKSAWTIVSLLAVLKAGGAFVLLDPKHVTPGRTGGIIRDTKPKLLIAGGQRESLLLTSTIASTITAPGVLIVDKDCMSRIRLGSSCILPHSQKHSLVSPQDLAYIFFTSGTTGTPKGSVNTHSGFCTAAASWWKRAGLSNRSRVLQYASYTFDACLSEILTVLLFGGCVCVPTEEERTENIVGAINEARVNVALLTPSVARLITPTEVPALEILFLCGEAVTKADVAHWKGHVKLANSYGPSECAVATTVNECILDDPTNIGRPTDSVCWIVDPENHERLVPIGAVGELIIEGHIVANGYLNDEAKTAESFIKPPEWLFRKRLESGLQVLDRVYKTGDLVRHNSDGSIKFIGRKDTQSKLHGQRMELGEIEYHVLSQSSLVRAVAVEVIESEVCQRRQALAAFFTWSGTVANSVPGIPDDSNMFLDLPDDIAIHLQALQDSLTNALPSYMIPTLFVPLSAFPLSPSRKLDRRALRSAAAKIPAARLCQYSLAGVSTGRQAPRSDTEKSLHRAWVETLGSPPEMIDRNTSFFRAGGDSLNAMRLVSTARQKYGLILTVATIFEHPRLRDMATRIEFHNRGQESDASSPKTPVEAFGLLPKDHSVDRLLSIAAVQCQVRQESVLDLYPCTPLQEGLMTISVDKKGAYLRQNIYRIPKTLDVDRLKRAWEVVVAAHPILRTRIVSIDSVETVGCLQAILDDQINWLHPTCTRGQYLADDLDLPVTWGSPLNRFAILAPADLNDDHVYLVWTVHHALFDEWSLRLTMEQLEQAYHGQALPTVLPFNRFIEYTTNSDDVTCAAFWDEELGGNVPVTLPQLPSNGYVPRLGDCDERIIDLAREAGQHITTPILLRASWALVTGRYAATEDIVFGASVHGRSAAVPGIDKINGPTMATVPVKVHLGRELPISGFIERIQTQATKMIAFEHWGLQNIARVSETVPAFQNIFVVHLPGKEENKSPLSLGTLESTNPDYLEYALVMECFLEDNGHKVLLKVSYDRHVVPYAPQLNSHFEWVMQQLILRVDDDSPLGTLDFCSPEDKACIFGWNRESPRIIDNCIHDLVTQNVKQRPDAPAICSWDFSMTYADLEAVSIKLAGHLVFLGVKPEQIVPAIFEKSAWVIVAQLAVLKAGGVICMLDPARPRQELESHISTVNATLLLASETYSTLLQRDGRGILPIGISTMESLAEAYCATALPIVLPENAAYVVFTRSTTGRSKAVITEHRAFVSCSASYASKISISETSRVLQLAAFGTRDRYILETFTTLTEGGCVCVAKDDTRTNFAQLGDAIRTLRVTWAMMTPSAARLLPRDQVRTLKTLVLNGEPMSRLDRSRDRTVRLMNVYGTSECSVLSVINDSVMPESDSTAIGRGVGSRCWIVEPHDHNLLAPVGCIGELLLESAGLARGYLGQPCETAEAFIRGPAWLQAIRPNSRLYKTGHLVQYSSTDGIISFVGRKDMQSKVHRQQLQLQEIEHHLMAHEQVSIAAVTRPKMGKFAGKLVATLSLRFLTTIGRAGDSSPTLKLVKIADKTTVSQQLSDIRARVGSSFPRYMVPSVWAVVYRVPWTTSLRVDKHEIITWLEAMSENGASEIMGMIANSEEEDVGGINVEMERRLRNIIAKVLGLLADQVLLGSSFISLGGDSITAIHITARCYAERIAVKTKDILRCKSIREIAEHATVIRQEEGMSDAKSTGLGSSSDTFCLTPIQKLYFTSVAGYMLPPYLSLTGSSHFNQSVLLRLTRDISFQELAKAVEAIVRQHGMLRARFTHSQLEGTWTQRILPAADIPPVLQHHILANSCDIDPIIAASQRRIDPIGGPIFAADLYTIASPASSTPAYPREQQPQRLLFMVAHHLVADLVSLNIIQQDIEEFLATGRLLSTDGCTFKAWAEMQERYVAQNLQSPEQLANMFPVSKADHSYWGVTPDSNVFGETLSTSFSLDIGPTRALLGACNECFGTKPDDLLISALLVSFTTVFTDRDMPTVFCEGHGRDCAWDNDIDLTSTVGWFTLLYPLHVRLSLDHQGRHGRLVDAIRRTKDARARISGHTWSYFASRVSTRDGCAAFENHWPMEIIFNYVGGHQKQERNDVLLVPVPRHGLSPSPNHTHDSMLHHTADVGTQCHRMALFDIHVDVGSDGRAMFHFAFNKRTLYQDKIHLWMSTYRELLLEAVDQLTGMSPEPTLSNFPLMPHLTYEHIDRIKPDIMPALGLSRMSDIADIYPCGPAQKGIVISQALSARVYRESFLYTVLPSDSEPINLERLETAWRTVVSRHDILRTVIVEDTLATGEGYYQVVLRHWDPRVRRVECDDTELDDKDVPLALEKLRKLSATNTRVTADAGEKAEPAHSILFYRDATRTYIYLEMSHALMDASSMPVLLSDIATAYGGNRLGIADEVNVPRYRDFIAHVRGIPMENSIDYWIAYLDGVEQCHISALRGDGADALHAARTPGAPDTGSVPIDLMHGSIFDFCHAHDLTPASVFKVAWALVLHVYTGMSQVCFGFLTSGRDAPIQGVENIIGLMCNMLVVRVGLDRDRTCIELLKDAHESWVNSIEHQFVSLAELQHQFQQRRAKATSLVASSHSEALFNTALSLTGRDSQPRLENARAFQASIAFDALGGNESSEYDGTVSIWPTTDSSGFRAVYTYKLSHMTESQAKTLAVTYSKAVKCVIEMSCRRLHEWCLVSEDDASGRIEGSATSTTATAVSSSENAIVSKPDSACVDEVISVFAENAPNRPAVYSWDGQLTYRELEAMSTQLAQHLAVDYGVGPEVFVPVCMEKSVWFVVSILAVLKAGGAFVPMDATQSARFQTTLQQTNAHVVLTSEMLKDRISNQPTKPAAIVVDGQFIQKLPQDSSQYAHRLRKGRHDGNAAYVIFTSGSTGMPKGVVIEHRAWCASAVGWIEGRGMNEQTRKLQYASYSFDAAVGDVLGTLMAGGCICIPSEAERLDNIEAAITRMQVNVLDIPPSVLGILEPENVASVRTIVIAGESPPEHEVRRWCGRVKMVLAYGPTECSVESSLVTCQSVNPLRPSNIGFPKKVCRYWVVSDADHDVLVPTGAIGELLIEGEILARGYLNDPARTAAAFITNPAWATKGANQTRRMYKTGDLVQRNEDGSYRYVGRKDRQIKIRSQRVELGEVEHHVYHALEGKHIAAAETVEVGNNVRLVAFVALGDELDNITGKNLHHTASKFDKKYHVRATVAATAPSYMVPSAVVPLRSFPLLPSRKIDRKQIRHIALSFFSHKFDLGPSAEEVLDTSNRLQLTSVQRRMRGLWADVLNKDVVEISLEDSFLDQGGDSILAIKLASICRTAGLVLSVADFLRHQGLAALCQRLEALEDRPKVVELSLQWKVHKPLTSLGSLASSEFIKNVISPRVSTNTEGIQDIVEASPMQTKFIESSLLRGRGSTNYFAFHLKGNVDEARLHKACQALVAKHSILRTSFVAFKRRLFQVVLRSLSPEFHAFECPESQQKQVAASWVEADRDEPVSLGQPILRFLFLGGKSESMLVMRLSHAQYDGMSFHILADDLVAIYQDRVVPDRPTFVDFVHAARESNEQWQGAESYWTKLLAGATMTNILSHMSPPYQSAWSETVSRTAVNSKKGVYGFTFVTILEAAWALVLTELSSSNDVVFGHLTAGRNMSIDGLDVDGILGPCINIIPLRVRIQGHGATQGARTVLDLLRLIHDQRLAAMPFETFGMDKMVEHATNWSPWTRFSSVVQYQNLEGRLEALEDFGFGAARCRLSAFQARYEPADILVLATPKQDSGDIDIELQFGGREGALSRDFMDHILHRLLANIEMLSSIPSPNEQQLPLIIPQSVPLIPLPVQGNSADRTAAAVAAGYSFESMPMQIKDIVTRAWTTILEPLPDQRIRTLDRSRITGVTPFYEIWGSLIAAAQFADFYAHHSVDVSVEDMVEHPSMLTQSILLARQMHVSIHPGTYSVVDVRTFARGELNTEMPST